MSCDYSLFSSLFFSSFYILDTLASTISLSRSRSLYLFLSLSTDSNVSRQRNSARSFRDDVSRSIDSQTLIDFSIFQLARTGCTHGHWCLSRDHCIREPKRNTDHRVCVLTIRPYTSVVCRWLHEGHVYVLVRAYTNPGTHTNTIALRDSCRRVKKS